MLDAYSCPAAIVCRLRRIQSSRYEIGLQMQGTAVVVTLYIPLVRAFFFYSLARELTPLTVNTLPRQCPREIIFPDRNQSATPPRLRWQIAPIPIPRDLEAEYVFNRLGEDLAHWQQLLTEIKKARSTFDASEKQESFGMCVIDYEQGAGAGECQV
jgi:hypothetical protein